MKQFMVCVAVLALAGCSDSTWVDPIYEIDDDQKLVVMPFWDQDFPTRWDSPLAHELGRQAASELAQNVDFRVRNYEDTILDLLQAERKDPRELRERDVAEITGVDFLLVCDIEQWDLRDPLNINLNKGTAKIRAKLYKLEPERYEDEDDEQDARERLQAQNDARRRAGLPEVEYVSGGNFVREVVVNARYPETYLNQYGDIFLDPDQIELGLIRTTAEKVAKLLYGHEELYRLTGDEQNY